MKNSVKAVWPITIFILFFYSTTSHALQESWAQKTLQHMTLRQKIGQLFVVDVGTEDTLATLNRKKNKISIRKLIASYHVGGIIFLEKRSLHQQVLDTNNYQKLSKYPLLVVEDLEWGLGMRITDGISFPRNMTLGAIQQEKLIYQVGKEIGRQCYESGVSINLAPVGDVNNNHENPVINNRSFGENPQKVAQYSTLFMRGLQDAGIIACGKHFPGHGDTHLDSHHTIPFITRPKNLFYELELFPFRQLIDAGVGAILSAHLKVPVLDPKNIVTFSYPIITKLLKEELKFKGLVITDALNMGALKQYRPGIVELKAFMAGHDILLCSQNVPYAITLIEKAVRQKKISLQDLNMRVLKILQTKEYLELNKKRFVTTAHLEQRVSTPEALALKKQLYQEAITVVQNKGHLIPLVRSRSSLPIIQIGGTKDSSFMTTLQEKFSCVTQHIDADQSLAEINKTVQKVKTESPVIVAIFGMNKFANKKFGITESTLKLLKRLKVRRKKIILVLFGSPYSLKFFDNEEVIIVAYEEDPDAQEAAAQVIMGEISARGKLPVTASKKFYYNLGLTL